MTIAELHNRIHCWLWLYEHLPPQKTASEIRLHFGVRKVISWKREMLVDIISLNVPVEIENTQSARKLEIAIQYAKTGNIRKLKYIAKLLKSVNQGNANREYFNPSVWKN